MLPTVILAGDRPFPLPTWGRSAENRTPASSIRFFLSLWVLRSPIAPPRPQGLRLLNGEETEPPTPTPWVEARIKGSAVENVAQGGARHTRSPWAAVAILHVPEVEHLCGMSLGWEGGTQSAGGCRVLAFVSSSVAA